MLRGDPRGISRSLEQSLARESRVGTERTTYLDDQTSNVLAVCGHVEEDSWKGHFSFWVRCLIAFLRFGSVHRTRLDVLRRCDLCECEAVEEARVIESVGSQC